MKTSIITFLCAVPEGIYSRGGEIYKMADMIPIAHNMLRGISKQTFENVTDHYLFLNSTIFIYDYKCLNNFSAYAKS